MISSPRNQPIWKVGIPCHFRPTNENVSACGIECPQYSGYDGRDTDCLRCRKTRKWKTYMGLNKNTKKRN